MQEEYDDEKRQLCILLLIMQHFSLSHNSTFYQFGEALRSAPMHDVILEMLILHLRG